MSYETLLVEIRDSVGLITLNRPDRLNAINYQMSVDLEAVLAEFAADGQVRSVILTGAGRAFCAGADIKEMVDPAARLLPIYRHYNFFNRLADFEKPVLAAVNGACNGGGLELALCCDFRLAADTASFGLGEVKLGVIPAGGGTIRLPRLIGAGRAKEFMYFGNRVDAGEAERIGLVNRVVPLEHLMPEVRSWAAELAERPPLSLKMLKSCVDLGLEMDLTGALDYEKRCAEVLFGTDDRQEGMRAFVEKRKPVFKGR
ncbi:MAG: enoyl-CoA hydratase/isomerase family protein [Proteobacteria bacterium]|nr:enoyl-CoA hydratase/isomerase family protein [Pseudomonadota bacterium]